MIFKNPPHKISVPFSLLCIVMCLFFFLNTGPQQGCGGYLTRSDGTFASPDSDSNGRYDKNLNCIWLMTAPVNKLIRLTFNTFALEAATSLQRCIYDYVKVRLLCFLTESSNTDFFMVYSSLYHTGSPESCEC